MRKYAPPSNSVPLLLVPRSWLGQEIHINGETKLDTSPAGYLRPVMLMLHGVLGLFSVKRLKRLTERCSFVCVQGFPEPRPAGQVRFQCSGIHQHTVPHRAGTVDGIKCFLLLCQFV